MQIRSTEGIADVVTLRGLDAPPDAPPDLLFEIPHGATSAHDYEATAASLRGELPDDLIAFYYANTDVGAFEVAFATAEAYCAAWPARTAALVRCRIPRTFIDCNRRIDQTASDFAAGGVTPGLPPWITDPQDRDHLLARYDAYQAIAQQTLASLASGGAAVLLHTYAPRTVDVAVDHQIVPSLRAAWAPDRAQTWPLRPELDVIGRTTDGHSLTPLGFLDALRAAVEPLGWTVGDSATYPMHPSTVAWHRVAALPSRTVCLEIRRDLLAERWEPFAPMLMNPEKVHTAAHALLRALDAWWPPPPAEGA
jgi:hypothetical protein